MCIDWVSKIRLDKTTRCLSLWGQKKPAGIKLQYFCQYEDKNNQRTKLSIYILDTIESESTTRLKNRSSDRMMTSDWLVNVSDDRYTTSEYNYKCEYICISNMLKYPWLSHLYNFKFKVIFLKSFTNLFPWFDVLWWTVWF